MDGFRNDTIRVGVRSFYEDWSLIEGAALLEQQDGAWGQVDFIEVDPT